MLAHAQQDAVRNRQQLGNQIRSLLREYYPAAMEAFQSKAGGLARPDARAVLAAARAAKVTLTQLRAALKRAGRRRGIDAEAERLRDFSRAEHARHPDPVEAALGRQRALTARTARKTRASHGCPQQRTRARIGS